MIYFDDDSVKIGGIILPGIYKSMEVNQDAQVDEQTVEGSSRRPKQVTGYDDAKITIEISLEDSEHITKEAKLQVIQNLFKKFGQSKPIVHELVSTHSSIRGIRKVILKNMTSKESNKRNEILVNLELLQYDTVTISASKSNKSKAVSAPSSTLTDNYTSYANNNKMEAPKQSKKTSKSPAKDKRR